MKFRIHNEGWVYFVSSIIIAIIVYPFSNILGIFVLFLALFIYFFFRDPNRYVPVEDVIVSPADGIVTKISKSKAPCDENNTPKLYIKVSIFLSIFDVHVNRTPIDGIIKKINYIHGKFINASLDKSSDENEKNIITIDNNGEIFYIVQIAGLIARRIVCNVKANQEIKKGDKIGIIKFGSRVDFYIPNNKKILISEGQKMIAGETIISNPKNINHIKSSVCK